MHKIKLCGRGRCCPEVLVKEDEIVIQDDYLNTVIMTREQFDELKEKILAGEFE